MANHTSVWRDVEGGSAAELRDAASLQYMIREIPGVRKKDLIDRSKRFAQYALGAAEA